MKTVFISSPYTIGDVGANVGGSMKVALKLIDLGYAPYCPLLSHFLHMVEPKPYQQWLSIDIAFLKRCDCVLRLPGKSEGADFEVKYAEDHNIPVYYSIDDIK